VVDFQDTDLVAYHA